MPVCVPIPAAERPVRDRVELGEFCDAFRFCNSYFEENKKENLMEVRKLKE